MSESSLPPSPSGPPAPGTPPTHGELKGALKTFKKKLRSTRLDNESGKITGPLSGGRSSGIVAITPPSQFRQEIWDELVKQGKLKYEGHGTYELVGPLD